MTDFTGHTAEMAALEEYNFGFNYQAQIEALEDDLDSFDDPKTFNFFGGNNSCGDRVRYIMRNV